MARVAKDRVAEKIDNINRLEVFLGGRLVGYLGLTTKGKCIFEYSKDWLKDGFAISPLKLPLESTIFEAPSYPFKGLFGVFADCLPDGWGLLVLDRHLQKRGINPYALNALDRLSLVGTAGRGALEFRPDRSDNINYGPFNLDLLAKEAEAILETYTYTGDGVDEFVSRGGFSGGARPKVFIKYENREYLLKFALGSDPKDIGLIEYEYSLLAKKCGLEMPETKLFANKYFATERFDRTANGKVHVVSVAGLLDANYREPCIEYSDIFSLCVLLTHNMVEMYKLYRLMVFNYLIDNFDDHAKNFSFLFKEGEWHLAPAYDILPSVGFDGYHTTLINGKLNPQDEDIFEVAKRVGLNMKKAHEIFYEIKDLVVQERINLR